VDEAITFDLSGLFSANLMSPRLAFHLDVPWGQSFLFEPAHPPFVYVVLLSFFKPLEIPPRYLCFPIFV